MDVCVCVCVCVCVYPGYVQSPGWDGRTLIYLQNLVGKRVTVKVPLQHKVMFSFKDVHMKGRATPYCYCQTSGVRVGVSGSLKPEPVYGCEFILLSPVLRDIDEMEVLVIKRNHDVGSCSNSETGECLRDLFDCVPFDDDW